MTSPHLHIPNPNQASRQSANRLNPTEAHMQKQGLLNLYQADSRLPGIIDAMILVEQIDQNWRRTYGGDLVGAAATLNANYKSPKVEAFLATYARMQGDAAHNPAAQQRLDTCITDALGEFTQAQEDHIPIERLRAEIPAARRQQDRQDISMMEQVMAHSDTQTFFRTSARFKGVNLGALLYEMNDEEPDWQQNHADALDALGAHRAQYGNTVPALEAFFAEYDAIARSLGGRRAREVFRARLHTSAIEFRVLAGKMRAQGLSEDSIRNAISDDVRVYRALRERVERDDPDFNLRLIEQFGPAEELPPQPDPGPTRQEQIQKYFDSLSTGRFRSYITQQKYTRADVGRGYGRRVRELMSPEGIRGIITAQNLGILSVSYRDFMNDEGFSEENRAQWISERAQDLSQGHRFAKPKERDAFLAKAEKELAHLVQRGIIGVKGPEEEEYKRFVGECAHYEELTTNIAELERLYAGRNAIGRFVVRGFKMAKDALVAPGIAGAAVHSRMKGRNGAVTLEAMAEQRSHHKIAGFALWALLYPVAYPVARHAFGGPVFERHTLRYKMGEEYRKKRTGLLGS